MDIYMPMSTTIRHNKITRRLGGNLLDLEEKENAVVLQEDCSLVYFGSENKVSDIRLVDLADITNENDFIYEVIDDLKTVEPDLVLFHHNRFIVNERETKIAGQPDLIVEVWSKGNTQKERDFKKYLYSTSPITEHWYIDQDSNKIRLLSKPQGMVTKPGNEVKSQAKTFSSVTVAFGQNLETFDKTDGVFIGRPLA